MARRVTIATLQAVAVICLCTVPLCVDDGALHCKTRGFSESLTLEQVNMRLLYTLLLTLTRACLSLTIVIIAIHWIVYALPFHQTVAGCSSSLRAYKI